MKIRNPRFQTALTAMMIIGLAFSLISTVKATTISGVPDYAQVKWYY